MLAGVGVRQPATMPTSGRTSQFGDFGSFQSKNNSDEIPALGQGFATGSSKPWGQSIWGNNAIGSGFGSARDAANRGRAENAPFASSNADVEAKKGSASLVASSESEAWGRQRSPWGTADAGAAAKAPLSIPRSSGVSPSRPMNNSQPQAQQSYIEPAQAAASYFTTQRAGSISHTSSGSMARPRLDPTSGSFSLGRPQDGLANGFAAFGRYSEVDAQAAQRAAEQTVNAWAADTGSVHSPTDDRRSVANSDYFVSSSAGPSRSGSLPPSRHGAEPSHISQAPDAFARFQQMPPPSRGHNPSFSQANGRAFAERSGSIQSDSLALFGRLALENDPDLSVNPFKSSVNVNGAPTFENPQPFEQSLEVPPSLVRHDEGSLNGGGAFPSESLANGFYPESVLQARGLQLNNRVQQLTPGGSNFRQSPYNSHSATPPAFDHLYPSRSEQQHTRTASTQSAVNPLTLDRKLQHIQSFQLSQEQQRIMAAQYPQMVAAAAAAGQFRAPYPYYAVPGLMNMNPMHPGLQMPTIAASFPTTYVDVPSGPRDQMPADIRSKCLDDFKANNKTNKKYELKDIYDHIAEFSGDQHGSRFIQSKLETANSEEKERVFREIYPECLQLMQDVFGNYVIQKFFEHGDQSQKKALASKMKGNMLQLSLQMYGCRVVQKALEHILSDQQASLVKELENHVIKCVKDQNGNHVIQKAIERVPPEHIQFIFRAFTGQVATLATHAYGCRVIQRMLEHCEPTTRDSILQELHLCGASLITDSYGNYVTQHIIEHGGPDDRAKVINLIRDQLISFSKHKFASNVVEKCLVYGSDDQRHDIMMKIVEKNERGESSLLSLIKDGYGNYVIQKLLDTLGPSDYAIFVENLQPEMLKAKRLISGKHVQAVEKKMHRYDRYDVLPDNPCRSSISTTGTSTDRSAAATPPPLTNDTQSPKSTSVSSANNSTIDEPVHAGSTDVKAANTFAEGGVAIGISEAT